jgi:hypothetical protein
MFTSKRMKLSNAAPREESTGSAIVRFYDPAIQAKDALGRTHEQILSWSNDRLEHSHNYIQMLFPLPEGSPFNWSAPIIDYDTMKAFRARNELRQGLRESFERMLNFYGFAVSLQPEPGSESTDNGKDSEQASTEKTSTSTAATVEPLGEGSKSVQTLPATTDKTVPEESSEIATTGASSAETALASGRYHITRGPNWHTASENWAGYMDHNHLRITRIIRCLRVLGLQRESEAFFAALKSVAEDPKIRISGRSVKYWTRAAELPLHIPPSEGEDECEWLKEWESEQQ